MKCLQSNHHMGNVTLWCNSTRHFGELVALQEESVHSFFSTVLQL